MAASMSSLQRKEDFKDQFLTCSLCFEPYDNNEHQAKFLPCLHSYCKSCLRQHAGKGPRFKCPNCRIVVKLVDESIDSLPNNFIVENLKDFQDIFNLAVPCSNCDEGDQAASFCHDCNCYLCGKCVDMFHKRALRHHKLSTMQELQEEKNNPKLQQRCKKHPTMPLNLYCKNTDCKIPACASCGLIDHRSHELIDLTAAVSEIVADMRQSFTKVATRNQELTKKRTAVETMQKTLNDNFNKTEKAMQESVQKVHSVIDSRYDDAHSHLKHLHQAEMNRWTESNESIDLLATQMTSACEFANKACDTSQSAQLLTSQNQIMERLHELENAALPPTTESDNTDFFLTAKHYSAIEQIEGALTNVCDVDWWKPPQELEKKDAMKNLEEEKISTLEQRLQDHSLSSDEILKVVTAEREAFDKKLEVTRKELSDLRFTSSEQIAALEQQNSQLNTTIIEDSEELKNRERKIADLGEQHNKEMEDLNQRLLDASEKLQASENARLLVEKEKSKFAGKVDPNQCTIKLGQRSCKNYRSATVQTVDFNGQLMTTGGVKVEATQDGDARHVRDNKDGTYTFQYHRSCSPFHVYINGTPMKGSPFAP